MKLPGKLGVAAAAIAAVLLAMGVISKDQFASFTGSPSVEDATTVMIERARTLCSLPPAERISEIESANADLGDEMSLWVACGAEEVAAGPPSTKEVNETAAEVVEEAATQAEEAAAEVDAEIKGSTEANTDEPTHSDEVDPLMEAIEEAKDAATEDKP
ncbi:MAG: hypothetical protein ACR2RL_21520 [Gammaproteobacteria bacterium]